MKYWHWGYGVALTLFLACGLIAGIVSADLVFQRAVKTVLSYSIPIHLGIIVLFSVLERIVPAAGPRKSFRGYLLNLKVVLLRNVTAPLIAGMFGALGAALGQWLNLGWIDLRFSTDRGLGLLILAALLSVFILDFFYYWLHRFQHENRILWQEHKVHHMDEQICALARESPLEPFLQGAAITLPMTLLFKLTPIEGMIASYVGYLTLAWSNVLVHTNIRWSLGRATLLFAGPQVHRIHHSRLPEHFDKNYAAMFPIWDVLFGTYHHPQRDEYPPTGVHDERDVQTFMAAVTLPFKEWWRMLRGRHGQAVS